MSLELTLIALTVTAAIFGGSLYMDRRPREIGKVSLIPFRAISFLALIFIVILAAHLISVWSGAPLPGRSLRF